MDVMTIADLEDDPTLIVGEHRALDLADGTLSTDPYGV